MNNYDLDNHILLDELELSQRTCQLSQYHQSIPLDLNYINFAEFKGNDVFLVYI